MHMFPGVSPTGIWQRGKSSAWNSQTYLPVSNHTSCVFLVSFHFHSVCRIPQRERQLEHMPGMGHPYSLWHLATCTTHVLALQQASPTAEYPGARVPSRGMLDRVHSAFPVWMWIAECVLPPHPKFYISGLRNAPEY